MAGRKDIHTSMKSRHKRDAFGPEKKPDAIPPKNRSDVVINVPSGGSVPTGAQRFQKRFSGFFAAK